MRNKFKEQTVTCGECGDKVKTYVTGTVRTIICIGPGLSHETSSLEYTEDQRQKAIDTNRMLEAAK